MCKRQSNRIGRELKRIVFVLLVLTSSAGTIWAIANGYSGRVRDLAEEIVLNAEELRDATSGPTHNRIEVDEILAEMKELISEYEAVMVFAESPYPGEIMLGTTPGGDSTWLEALCETRYEGPLKEIRIRRTGNRANYLRINDIEITYSTPAGWGRETFNKNARTRLYSDGIFRLTLPRPMRVRRIRIYINHESTGLQICGIPYHPPLPPQAGLNRHIEPSQIPEEVLLGTTAGGDGTWLETLCNNPYNRPVQEIRLKRTGRKASYLRINDIEVTTLTGLSKTMSESKNFGINSRPS